MQKLLEELNKLLATLGVTGGALSAGMLGSALLAPTLITKMCQSLPEGLQDGCSTEAFLPCLAYVIAILLVALGWFAWLMIGRLED
jgi:hypothetical protein